MLRDDPMLRRFPTGPWVSLDYPLSGVEVRIRHTGHNHYGTPLNDFEMQQAIELWVVGLMWAQPVGRA